MHTHRLGVDGCKHLVKVADFWARTHYCKLIIVLKCEMNWFNCNKSIISISRENKVLNRDRIQRICKFCCFWRFFNFIEQNHLTLFGLHHRVQIPFQGKIFIRIGIWQIFWIKPQKTRRKKRNWKWIFFLMKSWNQIPQNSFDGSWNWSWCKCKINLWWQTTGGFHYVSKWIK